MGPGGGAPQDLDPFTAKHQLPARLGLYLALGWTQQTTTHQWPASERWRTSIAAPLPEHLWQRLIRRAKTASARSG